MRILVLLFILVFTSCSGPQLIGKWEVAGIKSTKSSTTLDVKQGDWYYWTIEFTDDSTVIFGGRDGANEKEMPYSMRQDTVIFTAPNGYKTAMPILKLTNNEMHTLSLDSTNIHIFKRAD